MGIKLLFAMYAFAMAILFYWPVVRCRIRSTAFYP